MNLHEYQGKNILKSFGVSIQEGKVAHSVSEAMDAAKELTNETGTEWFVVKAASIASLTLWATLPS